MIYNREIDMKGLDREGNFARNNTEQSNTNWSKARVNHEERACYFSAWVDQRRTDRNGDVYYVVRNPGLNRSASNSPVRKEDQDARLDLVLKRGYSARINFVEAVDGDAVPRSIKDTRTSIVFDADLVKTDAEIRAYPQGRVVASRRPS